MTARTPHILLVNPWIHDFAAYDVWARPYGLLLLAGILREHGFSVSFIDCLDRFHPRAKPSGPGARNGRGPYIKERIAKPSGLADVARNYSRYGIPPDWLRKDLETASSPDLILITSLMTYWYPGVAETVGELRRFFPHVPVVLGGIYATLCPEHAAHATGADKVVTGSGVEQILTVVEEFTGVGGSLRLDPQNMDTWPYPAFDLQHRIASIPLLSSLGCPYSCGYCASNILQPRRLMASPGRVVREIRHWHDACGVQDFVFYDDALLVNRKTHAEPLFEQIIQSGPALRFHTPNAVHIHEITQKTASLMKRAGFVTLRLGLETLDADRQRPDRKVQREEFFRAAACLREAGFDFSQVGAYLLAGLPGQELDAVAEDILMVKKAGVSPILAYYSPIPRTAMWPEAVRAARYDLESDPVYTNNAVFPCRSAFDWKQISRLKELAA
ncbi:MAG: cobalamin-dependent protein [Desulfosalsimonadaceae bacterium]